MNGKVYIEGIAGKAAGCHGGRLGIGGFTAHLSPVLRNLFPTHFPALEIAPNS